MAILRFSSALTNVAKKLPICSTKSLNSNRNLLDLVPWEYLESYSTRLCSQKCNPEPYSTSKKLRSAVPVSSRHIPISSQSPKSYVARAWATWQMLLGFLPHFDWRAVHWTYPLTCLDAHIHEIQVVPCTSQRRAVSAKVLQILAQAWLSKLDKTHSSSNG